MSSSVEKSYIVIKNWGEYYEKERFYIFNYSFFYQCK